jgi:hypothetical protein
LLYFLLNWKRKKQQQGISKQAKNFNHCSCGGISAGLDLQLDWAPWYALMIAIVAAGLALIIINSKRSTT